VKERRLEKRWKTEGWRGGAEEKVGGEVKKRRFVRKWGKEGGWGGERQKVEEEVKKRKLERRWRREGWRRSEVKKVGEEVKERRLKRRRIGEGEEEKAGEVLENRRLKSSWRRESYRLFEDETVIKEVKERRFEWRRRREGWTGGEEEKLEWRRRRECWRGDEGAKVGEDVKDSWGTWRQELPMQLRKHELNRAQHMQWQVKKYFISLQAESLDGNKIQNKKVKKTREFFCRMYVQIRSYSERKGKWPQVFNLSRSSQRIVEQES